jgi:hypothetical protein
VSAGDRRRVAATMSAPAIAKLLGVDHGTSDRWFGGRSMPEPATILSASPEEVYPLMMARPQRWPRNTSQLF